MGTLIHLRDLGNTVIVVEHDEDAIRAADHVIDIGPGAGVHGGQVVAEGTLKDIMAVPESLTGQYMSGKRKIEVPKQRVAADPEKVLKLTGARGNNLKDVTLTLPVGLFTCITGVSGSGKSTLLNMLAGLEHPTKGEIVIAGKHIEKLNEKQLVTFRRERVGFIFQSYNLIGTMDAVENVALPLSFRGMPRAARIKRAKQYLKLVGLEKFMTHMPNQMSGGQQQRVGIARALAMNPQIIFADEPTGNLDSKTTMEVLKLMQKVVREQKQTLVMVTHDNNLATYADRIFKIIDGKIVSIEENHHEVDLCS